MSLQETSILTEREREKRQAPMVPSAFQNVLKDDAQRVPGRHKI